MNTDTRYFRDKLKNFSLLLFLVFFLPLMPRAQEKQVQMASAANALIQSFTPAQKTEALLSYNDSERLRWSNMPQNLYDRQGITMGALRKSQKLLVHQLLQTVLSEQGYLKAINVMRLDGYLHEEAVKKGQTGSNNEGSQQYWLTIFGQPRADHKWGWRFEGHHLSLNLTNTSSGITGTPMFFGADPATFPEGPLAGWQNMFAETDLARQLFQSLDATQKTKARVQNKIPEPLDILTRTGHESFLQTFKGVAFKELSKKQQQTMQRLVNVYLHNLNERLAAVYHNKIQWEKCFFGWWGGTEKGEPFYYRIHGPDFIIEYCSRLKDPDHIHTLFRYLPKDFGTGVHSHQD